MLWLKGLKRWGGGFEGMGGGEGGRGGRKKVEWMGERC